MILHLIQCEGCKKTHPFEPMMGMPADQLPESWITLFRGPLRQAAGSNYCSQDCLAKTLGVQLHVVNVAKDEGDETALEIWNGGKKLMVYLPKSLEILQVQGPKITEAQDLYESWQWLYDQEVSDAS